MSELILAIDQGTTGTTSLVVELDENGTKVKSRGYSEFPQHFPKPGWVEHELDEIWASTRTSVSAALEAAGIKGTDLKAIGITNQRETTGMWDADGKPAHRAIVWQDRRTAPRCEKLVEAGHEELIKSATGLVVDPYFSGTKVGWLLDEVDGLRARAEKGELRFGTMDTWLVFKLSGGDVHVTDATNASRTLMYDIHQGKWDPKLLDVLGKVPESLLPEVKPSSGEFAKTKGLDFLPDGIPIAGIAGDQQSALFGQACFQPGMAKCTYGTGAFALVNTGTKAFRSDHGMVTTIAWQLGDEVTYALEGSVFIAGAIVQWLRDGLEFFKSSAEIEELAAKVEDTDGVVLVPALTGLGAPHWRPEARGVITGLTRGTTRAHIARAALEGIAYQVYDLLDSMRLDSRTNIQELKVDGGASANNLLMQFQADLLQTKILRPKVLDTTAMGAAYLAALGTGVFSGLEGITKAWELDATYEPKASADSMKDRIENWKAAVSKA